MERTTTPMTEETVVDEIEEIFKRSMETFKSKCKQRIKFCINSFGSMNSISTQCFLPHFLLGFLHNGFIVNDMSSCIGKEEPKILWPFGLLARKYEDKKSIRVKVLAKENPAGGPHRLVEDLTCMEHSAMRDRESLVSKEMMDINPDEAFRYRFNMIIMQNWGLPELSDWWATEKPGAPQQRESRGVRSSPYWGVLELKLLLAKRRGVFPVLRPGTGCAMDILYAIFADALDEPKGDWL